MTYVYETITNKIVKQIESGVLPWKKPWGSTGATMERPLRFNGQPYKGINTVILWVTALECGYAGKHWMTFRQVKELGGHVKKGERASDVVFFKTLELEDEESEDGKLKRIPMLNTYKVFNVDQCEDLPEKYASIKTPIVDGLSDDLRIATADDWVNKLGANIKHGGDRAFFSPGTDHIQMPLFAQFKTADDYYATLLHELTHWSGGKSRLDRDLNNRFGTHKYAAEELIAELGSAFLCSDLEIRDPSEMRDDHAQYLDHWLAVMKADSKAIFTAAAKAEQACRYLEGLATTEKQMVA